MQQPWVENNSFGPWKFINKRLFNIFLLLIYLFLCDWCKLVVNFISILLFFQSFILKPVSTIFFLFFVIWLLKFTYFVIKKMHLDWEFFLKKNYIINYLKLIQLVKQSQWWFQMTLPPVKISLGLVIQSPSKLTQSKSKSKSYYICHIATAISHKKQNEHGSSQRLFCLHNSLSLLIKPTS